jgi:hypothetical protein
MSYSPSLFLEPSVTTFLTHDEPDTLRAAFMMKKSELSSLLVHSHRIIIKLKW